MTLRHRWLSLSLGLTLGLAGCGNEPVPDKAAGAPGEPAPAGDHPLPSRGETTPEALIVPSPVPKMPDPGPGPGMSKEGETPKPSGEVQPTTPAPATPPPTSEPKAEPPKR